MDYMVVWTIEGCYPHLRLLRDALWDGVMRYINDLKAVVRGADFCFLIVFAVYAEDGETLLLQTDNFSEKWAVV